METTIEYPVGALPRFVTTAEHEQIQKYQAQITMFDAHVATTARPVAEADRDNAIATYRSAPTDDTFAAMRAAMQRVYFVEHETGDNSAGIAMAARDNWLRSDVVPFLKPIIERGVALARQQLLDVTTEESRRHQLLIGNAASAATSAVVAAAEKPLETLDAMRQRLADVTSDQPIMSPQLAGTTTAILRFLCTRRLDELIDSTVDLHAATDSSETSTDGQSAAPVIEANTAPPKPAVAPPLQAAEIKDAGGPALSIPAPALKGEQNRRESSAQSAPEQQDGPVLLPPPGLKSSKG